MSLTLMAGWNTPSTVPDMASSRVPRWRGRGRPPYRGMSLDISYLLGPGRRIPAGSREDGVAMTDQWRILALDTGTSELEQSMLTYTVGFGQTVRIPRVMWVIQGPTTVVVDTSVPMHGRSNEFIGEDFSRSAAQEPANALRDAGVDPKDVELVVLTHLHWDHAGNCDLFPDARVLVQQQELRYAIDPGRFFRKSFHAPASGWGTPPW